MATNEVVESENKFLFKKKKKKKKKLQLKINTHNFFLENYSDYFGLLYFI
jgi:hypothetical protein